MEEVLDQNFEDIFGSSDSQIPSTPPNSSSLLSADEGETFGLRMDNDGNKTPPCLTAATGDLLSAATIDDEDISSHSLPKLDNKADEDVIEPCNYDVVINIVEYEKRGEGMNAYIVYKLVTKIGGGDIGGYSKRNYDVWRRFSDFLGLHDKLALKYVPRGVIVAPAPEKSVVGYTKAKMGKVGDAEDHSTNDFLERRRSTLERFIRRVSQHPILLIDSDFRDFLTFDGELPKAISTSALSGAGVKRMFRGIGDAITRITYHMDENDRWFEEKQNEIEELDESLKKLHGAVDSLVMYRRELGGGLDNFCKSVSLLAGCEENTSLARALSQLAETQEKVALLQNDQAEKDFYILSETLHDYLALIQAVKEVFYERTKVWQKWQTSQQDLTKKREIKTRYELTGKTDRLPQARLDCTEAEKRVDEVAEEFDKIGQQIRTEMDRFNKQRIIDFKRTLLQYLESLALSQQQLVKYWEAFIPEARAIIS